MSINRFLIPALLFAAALPSHAATKTPEKITNVIIRVDSGNDDWTQTNLMTNPGDVIIISEDGSKIKVGAWYAEIGADGHVDGVGALFIKIGAGSGKKIGAHGYIEVTEPGYIKLKVNDTIYKDNSGIYLPKITIIPKSLIPEAKEIVVAQ